MDREHRSRRALYRACHRGTKEMDWLVGRFAQAELEGMREEELHLFEHLLALADPELERLILRPGAQDGNEFSGLIKKIRHFHGLRHDALGRDGIIEG